MPVDPGHIDLDVQRQCRIQELQREAQATRDFIARAPKRLNAKRQELKTNLTDSGFFRVSCG